MILEVCLQSSPNMEWRMSTKVRYYKLGILHYEQVGDIRLLTLGSYVAYESVGGYISIFGLHINLTRFI
jgi:hypothetical protein